MQMLPTFLLRRPFLKISKTKVDVFEGILSMEYDNKNVKFNIHDTNLDCSINVIDLIARNFIELDNEEDVKVTTNASLKKTAIGSVVLVEGNLGVCEKGEASYNIFPMTNK